MPSHRLALHWIYSICGVGPLYARTGLGWDAMLATLACALGYKTVVLAASPNDNGLLHQEVPHGLEARTRVLCAALLCCVLLCSALLGSARLCSALLGSARLG